MTKLKLSVEQSLKDKDTLIIRFHEPVSFMKDDQLNIYIVFSENHVDITAIKLENKGGDFSDPETTVRQRLRPN